jgi:hypothetical protein
MTRHPSPEARIVVERCIALKYIPGLDPRDLAPPGPLARGWIQDTAMGMQQVQLYQHELEEQQLDEARGGRR